MINPIRTTDFDAIRLKLASPEDIHGWSHGEVTKPETINYRTQKPEKSGLFAEEIFGPSKDWECYCGKYKKIRYKGIVCDKCGVEVTRSLVRRERLGHIDLASPVSHIWFLRGVPSKIGLLLDLSVQELEKVIYFANFIVTSVDEEAKKGTFAQIADELKVKRKKIEEEVHRAKQQISSTVTDKDKADVELQKLETLRSQKVKELDDAYKQAVKELESLMPHTLLAEDLYQQLSMKYGHLFEAGIGSEAIRKLLQKQNLKEEIAQLGKDVEGTLGVKREKMFRRLKLMQNFVNNKLRPEWMILTTVPVIPPDLRPMVPLDGGRFATSDLNDLYRRVINRNNRLKQLIDLNAPEVICRNEKRMLQEAVDALIDNSARQGKTVVASTGQKRMLKSLADILKGKQGRFRQNLLGKRTDYSGRSVIVVGPHLKLDQCGIPKKMALELFKPFVMSRLIRAGLVHNVRSASRLIETGKSEIWDILEEIVKDTFVLLNRAPTLHRLGIQAFRPVLIEGKAIQIHPMVCTAFNADFDGDQMAVHVPLTEEAKNEARDIMLASRNLLKPATGDPVVTPTQDIVWGAFYMTVMHDKDIDPKTVKVFSDPTEAVVAYQQQQIALQHVIEVRMELPEPETKKLVRSRVRTTVGRILFARILPEGVPFPAKAMDKRTLEQIVRLSIELHGMERTVVLLDQIKVLSLDYLTRSGLSWGRGDLPVLLRKKEIIGDAERQVDETQEQYEQGLLTQKERRAKVISIWSAAKDEIVKETKLVMDPTSSVASMIESGARGSMVQLTQIIGMKGLVTNPAGEIIELPVKGSFQEGFGVLEYFISSHGARKGLTDTALRTANAGYLTRRLVDVSQDVVVLQKDCGDTVGFVVRAANYESVGRSIADGLLGRTLMETIKSKTGKILAREGEVVDEATGRLIRATPLKQTEVKIRSVLNCRTRKGVCQACYGFDLGFNKLVNLGTAVGIIAAQSIGEPGTQLTMRTFHTGGVVGQDITQGLPRVEELFEARPPKKKAFLSDIAGRVELLHVDSTSGSGIGGSRLVRIHPPASVHKETSETEETGVAGVFEYSIQAGYGLLIKHGDTIERGQPITEGSLDIHELYRLTDRERTQRYVMSEIQYIYSSQGQKLNEKHIEIIVRQMFSRILIDEPGDTTLLSGEVVEKSELHDENTRVGVTGGKLSSGKELLLGITKVSLTTRSFLSAASFQETARVLINAAVTGKVDYLEGLKENVIIGRLIPVGTGFRSLRSIPTEVVPSPDPIPVAAE